MDLGRSAALRVTNVDLIDGVSLQPVTDAVLDADTDGWITYAGPAKTAPPPSPDVPTVDGRGGTLLPGFFDCHVHLGMSSDNSVVTEALLTDPVLRMLQTTDRLRRTLHAGITSARDLCGLPSAFRQAVSTGLIEGPRLQVSVGIISHTGGHADTHLPSGVDLGFDFCQLADDVREARVATRRFIRAGADLIKICTSGGMTSATDDPDDEGLLAEEISAVVDEARRHRGRHVAAHAQGRAGILAAIRGGVHSIEHGFGIDQQACDLLGERGGFLVPTLSALFEPQDAQSTPPWRYEKKRRWTGRAMENIAAAIAGGINLAVGTDAGISPHGCNLAELGYLVELGMSPMAAIQAATANSAELLGVADRLGVLRPGMLADLVISEKNPLCDIGVLAAPHNIVLVAQQGVIRKYTLPERVSSFHTAEGPFHD